LPEPTTAADFIEASLDALEREHPQAYALVCNQMAGRRTLLTIDSEAVLLDFSARRAALTRTEDAGAALLLVTDWDTIFDLLDARLTIIEAVECGRFNLHGEARELTRFYDALLIYLRGAVRCPSFPMLLERLKMVQSR